MLQYLYIINAYAAYGRLLCFALALAFVSVCCFYGAEKQRGIFNVNRKNKENIDRYVQRSDFFKNNTFFHTRNAFEYASNAL